jgi:protein-tyrosine-phosphatase
VNLKTEKFVDEALRANDLRSDARPDVEYLRKCLRAGQRFGTLLAEYHDLLAMNPSERAARVGKVASSHRALANWLHKEFRFDFPDPKGGDQAAWLETMELLRARLQEMRG